MDVGSDPARASVIGKGWRREPVASKETIWYWYDDFDPWDRPGDPGAFVVCMLCLQKCGCPPGLRCHAVHEGASAQPHNLASTHGESGPPIIHIMVASPDSCSCAAALHVPAAPFHSSPPCPVPDHKN